MFLAVTDRRMHAGEIEATDARLQQNWDDMSCVNDDEFSSRPEDHRSKFFNTIGSMGKKVNGVHELPSVLSLPCHECLQPIVLAVGENSKSKTGERKDKSGLCNQVAVAT
jgi:hypothetical protein